MNIMGLGKVGCNIADQFAEYPQYKVFKIDRNLEGTRCLKLPDMTDPELYEGLDIKSGNFLKGLKGNVLFILSGASIVSGVTLRLLQKIHEKGVSISILYIEPELELLSEKKQLQERVVRNVLQQYARSGLLEKMYLVQNQALDGILGEVPILRYYETINSFLVSLVHMLNVFKNTESVTDTFSEPSDTARICTFGVCDSDGKNERLLYPIQEVREINYFFGIPESILETQSNLYRSIVDMVKSKITSRLRASYGIYKTSYEEVLTYGLYYSSQIQEKI